MGAPPARCRSSTAGGSQAIDDPTSAADEQAELVAEYEDRFDNPYVAAERGYVDAVIAAADTRRVLVDALDVLGTKREQQPGRRHSNTPL